MSDAHGFAFVLDEELSEVDLVAVVATTPSGERLQLWAEVELSGRTLVLRQFAIYGVRVANGELGWTVLRRVAYAAMEDFDVDCIRIEKARRTSGARPGRTAGIVEFRRRAAHSDPDSGGAA